MAKRLENIKQIKRVSESLSKTSGLFPSKEKVKYITDILKKEFGVYNESATKCRMKKKEICTCSEFKDPWDFGYDECPGWCPFCGKPWAHVRPGKSQPVCQCQD
jgi:hypothetical protein